jgi:uncharacterized membrane protein YebE (DUF533 family)
MDPEYVIGSVLKSVLTGGRKRSRGALDFLTGGKRQPGGLLTPGSLLTMVGLAWGAWESMQKSTVPVGGGASPVPGTGPSAPSTPPPPIPGQTPAPKASSPVATDATGDQLPRGALRIIQLLVSAARADGAMTSDEQQAILERARELGVERHVQDELAHGHSLREIVGDVTDPDLREKLYGLAFTVVRADEQVNGGERIYLAQLAHHIGLDPAAVAQIEKQIASQIDSRARGEQA